MSPILEENRHRYPDNWKEIRARILQRAGNCCEFCGVLNHATGYRDQDGEFIDCGFDHAFENGFKAIRIVLTIAHLDHTPEHSEPENLRALCQRCHNRYDVEHRKETRRARVLAGVA